MRLTPVLLLALIGLPARAVPIAFAGRAAFDRAAGSTIDERFARCSRATTVFAGPLGAAGTAACPAGAVRAGLTIASSGVAGDRALFLAAPFFGANPEVAVGEDGSAADWLTLDFAPTRAAGFDLFQDFGGGAQLGRAARYEVRVFSGAARIGGYIASVPSGGRAFFGVVSPDAPITAIEIDNPEAYEMVGGIAFAPPRALTPLARAALPAPEPDGLALLGFAAATIALARRPRPPLGT